MEKELERLQAILDNERIARAAAEQQAAVLAAKLESETEQRKAASEATIRARQEAKKSGEDAAQLRGQLAANKTKPIPAKMAK